MLNQVFTELTTKYTDNTSLSEMLWKEIEQNYSHKSRHYHNLKHLESLLSELNSVKDQIRDWDVVLSSLFYHDSIYSVTASDNEEKSAELAKVRLQQLSFPSDKIQECAQQILATKAHLKNTDKDTNFFTDADLSILGQDWELYLNYTRQVRKEYSIYPDLLYKPGRKKVVRHFLEMEVIYKTEYFYGRYESRARENLSRELKEI